VQKFLDKYCIKR